ncbi:uncharacterized protein [Pyrus communis]|uniref:uncharacterized protein n=1 Tax=Pyrus communis TaxID=23211 RepID=UPI0035BFFDC0
MGLESTIIRRAKVRTGFNRHISTVIGHIILDVKTLPIVSKQTFIRVSDLSPYNGILWRHWLIKPDAVTSIKYQKLWFRIPGEGVREIKSDQAASRRCTVQQTDQKYGVQTNVPTDETGWKPKEDAEHIILDPHQCDKTTKIGSRLRPEENEELTTFHKENHDVFVWSPSDMPGIDPKIACHKLHINPAAKLVIQKRRHFAPERVAIIKAEIDKLLKAGFIEKVAHSTWFAIVVLVKNKEKGK